MQGFLQSTCSATVVSAMHQAVGLGHEHGVAAALEAGLCIAVLRVDRQHHAEERSRTVVLAAVEGIIGESFPLFELPHFVLGNGQLDLLARVQIPLSLQGLSTFLDPGSPLPGHTDIMCVDFVLQSQTPSYRPDVVAPSKCQVGCALLQAKTALQALFPSQDRGHGRSPAQTLAGTQPGAR